MKRSRRRSGIPINALRQTRHLGDLSYPSRDRTRCRQGLGCSGGSSVSSSENPIRIAPPSRAAAEAATTNATAQR